MKKLIEMLQGLWSKWFPKKATKVPDLAPTPEVTPAIAPVPMTITLFGESNPKTGLRIGPSLEGVDATGIDFLVLDHVAHRIGGDLQIAAMKWQAIAKAAIAKWPTIRIAMLTSGDGHPVFWRFCAYGDFPMKGRADWFMTENENELADQYWGGVQKMIRYSSDADKKYRVFAAGKWASEEGARRIMGCAGVAI